MKSDAKEAVPAADMAEESGVLRARASPRHTVGADDDDALDFAHERPQRKAATVRVRRNGSAQAEVVRPGLLLRVGQRRAGKRRGQCRPLDPGLDLDRGSTKVQREDPVEEARVEQGPAAAELLSPHRVAAARDRKRAAGSVRAVQRFADLLERADGCDVFHGGGVEPGVDVVDDAVHLSFPTRRGFRAARLIQWPLEAIAQRPIEAMRTADSRL